MTSRRRVKQWISISVPLRKFDAMEQAWKLDRHTTYFRELEVLTVSRVQALRERTMNDVDLVEAKVQELLKDVGQARSTGAELTQRKKSSDRLLLKTMLVAKELCKSG